MAELLPGQAAWQIDPDAAVEEACRRIVACAAQKGTSLYLGNLALDRLPGEISSLTGLRQLGMFGGRIADYTALAPLTGMEELEIGSMKCPFPGLDFMRGWEKLKTLEIITPSAVDVKPAAGCLGLKRLSIWCTAARVDLSNLDALSAFRAVENVSLYGMASERFDTLTQWPRLKFVQLIDPTLTTLAGFERLTELEALTIRGAPISDLSPLARLLALKELLVPDTQVSDLSSLVGLQQLERLDVSGTQINSLTPLRELAACQREFNRLRRREQAFWNEKGLRDLNIARSDVTDLAPLADVESLEHLDLGDTAVSSLAPLHDKENLRSVVLSRSAVIDLGPRGTLSGLQSIDLSGTGVRNLVALEPARSLTWLNISDSQISDLAPLRLARECRSLHLRGSQVADLRPIVDTGSELGDHRYSPEYLDFRDTPAARTNDRFAELAALAEGSENNSTHAATCFFETKAYLRQLMGVPAKP